MPLPAPPLRRSSTVSTDELPVRDRAGAWGEWIDRLFSGLKSHQYGDLDFQGRMTTVHAGDVVLTRLEAQRHHVSRHPAQIRAAEVGYLKIVAPWVGCAGVGQKGREAWVTPDQWSIYDTTDSYAVANPVPVEHLIVMLPKDRLSERGLALDPLMARRLGGSGGIARVALETMRSAYRELPGMSDAAARGVGDAITQFVHLAMLDLAGHATAVTQREALRERIKRHVGEHLADPRLSVDTLALALNCSRRQLYNAFGEEPDGVAGYILRRRIEACRLAFEDPAQQRRSITDVALAHGFSSMAHFSRVFRAQLGVAPSDYRRGEVLPGGG
ncbi:helix-turn-helix domain-containing protein [Piscinibacter sakaiensis]|uniref:Transcriptional regulator, AraC family n=1 Tax=Piscinibacter sakaiensis TaxID=1547922 RepID=A0A0K8P0U9_PISS1|nr:helix-turn-helix domain-containing protein [Piscinibacter sakaiensis]GAP36287.1 transcriptional regulator, AraC family [Piscinibacter sakaiensis]